MNITIKTEKDLEMTASYCSWLSRPSIRNVSIMPINITADACHKYEKKIKSLFNDCGCIWASPVFIFTFILVFKRFEAGTIALWEEIVISFLVAIPTAFIAKLIALRWSYHRLNRTLANLKQINW